MEQKHVALYARTSTSTQTTGLEAQVRALQTYCRANGIADYVVYSDEGISGTKANRPELDRLMDAVESGEISSVIVYSFSRFARSVTHLLQALQKFEQHGVSFTSISENLDTRTSTGKFVFTILAALAALEREILVERVKTGLINARAKGKRLGRPQTRPNELIRELLLRGCSYRKIAGIAKCSHWSIAEVAKTMRSEKKSG
jgi:DNA invertase Pin-like site-specific DNA recombinase